MFAEDIGALVIWYSLQFDLNFIAQALLDNHCSDSYRHTAICKSALFTLEEQSFRNV